MEKWGQDVRFGARMLSKNPGFTIIAVVVLALGIGANTAIFSLVNSFLLRPLAVDRPEELVGLYSRSTEPPRSYRAFSYPNYRDVRERNAVFSSLAAHNPAMVGLSEGDSTRRVFADLVSSNYFSTFGVRLFLGREFTMEEERPGSEIPVAVASYPFWKKHGSDPHLVGGTIRINSRNFTVVGVAPPGFTGTTALISPTFYFPMGVYDSLINDFGGSSRRLADRSNHQLVLIGRLKPGYSQPRADAEMEGLAAQLARAYPAENRNQVYSVHSLSRMSISTNPQDDREVYGLSVLMMSMAAIVLLIACLNLANMLLARGTARRKEFAVRLALGGGRAQILRQLLTEGLMLSLLGGAAGIVLSIWGTRLLISSLAFLVPIDLVFRAAPDVRVLAATIGFCFLSTLVFGFGPAWKLSRADVVADLKEHAGEDRGGRHRLFGRRNLLVVGQIALSLTLLISAGLFIRSALSAAHADPGFRLENGLLAEVDASMAGYDETRGRETYVSLLERLKGLPGVESASMAATVPFGMVGLSRRVQRSDAPRAGEEGGGQAAVGSVFNIVGADYFKTLGVPLLRGRSFNRGEMQAGPGVRVAIIDDLLARRLWPGEDPLGRHIRYAAEDAPGGGPAGSVAIGASEELRPGKNPVEMTVVGVVPTLTDSLINSEPQPHLYVPFGQQYQSDMNIHLKIAAMGKEAEAKMLDSVRNEIRAAVPGLPILAAKTLEGHLDESGELWIFRTGARLFTAFGAVALLLAVVGLYGVKAYTVARRTREMGIRMALGASRRDTLLLVLGEGALLTLAGMVLGLALAFAVGRIIGSLLYNVSGSDPLTFAAAPVVLAAVSLLACWFPARRASKIDPLVALRYE